MMNSIEIAVAPRYARSECATNAGRVRWDGRNGGKGEAMIQLVEEEREVVLLDFITHEQMGARSDQVQCVGKRCMASDIASHQVYSQDCNRVECSTPSYEQSGG